jgi:methionyl-tRNA formyltransferase
VNLVFLGTPAFAVPSLERLASAHNVRAVYTQPDRPKGRGQKSAMPPVKEAALALGLPVHQPERVRLPEVVGQLAGFHAEAMIVVGYGQLIPRAILDLAPRGIFNVHASLLPKYRGAAPIQWAIARGEASTGVTIMKIDEGLDTGAMLTKWETPIGASETTPELSARLANAGADLLLATLERLDEIVPESQDGALATWAPEIEKEDGRIDWSMAAVEIEQRLRGFTPWPGCYGFLGEQRLHIWRAAVVDRTMVPGAVERDGRRLFAGCGQQALELLEVQLEGRKRMETSAFLNGASLNPQGDVLR